MRRVALLATGVAMTTVAGLVTAPSALAAAPTITSFSPSSGPLNSAVVVRGTNLSGATGATLDGVRATISSNTATAVTVRVPPTAGSGPISVTTPSGTATSSTSFTVSPGVFVVAAAAPGTSLTVTGSGFSSFEAVDVYLDTTEVAIASATPAGAFSTTVNVPAAETPGTHWISAVGRHSGYAAQKSFAVRTDWPAFGDDTAHRDDNRRENVLSASNVGGLEQAWTARVGASISSSTEVGGVLYTAAQNGEVTAVDATTGAQKWAQVFGNGFNAAPAYSGGLLYLPDNTGTIYALSATTGSTAWAMPTGSGAEGSAEVSGGLVYVGLQGSVKAFNATTGAQVWTFAIPGGAAADTTPAVADGLVYVGTNDQALFALDAASGAQRWSATTGDNIYSSPTVANGHVYVGCDDGYLYDLDARSGYLYDKFGDGENPIEATSAVGGNVLYTADASGEVFFYSLRDDSLLLFLNLGLPVLNNLVLANGVLYIGTEYGAADSTDGEVFAVSTVNGAVLWSAETGGAVGGLAVTDGTVTATSTDGRLYRYTLGGPTTTAAPSLAALHSAR